MSDNIKALMEQAEQARAMYRIGAISRDEAKKQIQPYIDEVNAKAKEIAKKYNMKPKLVTFGGYCR